MTDDKVISFKSRRSFIQEQKEIEEVKAAEEAKTAETKSESAIKHKETLLKMLDEARGLVEKDLLENVLIVGRHTETKLFYTDLAFDPHNMPAQDYFTYIGCLETLKIELADTAAMAPCLQPDGQVIGPEVVMIDEDGEIIE